MIKLVFALAIVLVASLVPERTVAEAKAILEAVKKSVDALDHAFATKDREAMKKLIAPDHVAVTPSTGHPPKCPGRVGCPGKDQDQRSLSLYRK